MRRKPSNCWPVVLTALFVLTVFAAGQTMPVVSIGTQGNERCYGLVQSQSGDDLGQYLLAGYTDVEPELDHDMLVVKADKYGAPVWAKTNQMSEEPYDDEATSVVQLVNDGTGDYAVCGWTEAAMIEPRGSADIFVTRYHSDGSVVWSNAYCVGMPGFPQSNDKAFSIIENNAGELVVTGYTDYAGSNSILVLRLNGAGVVQSLWLYDLVSGGGLDDEGYDAVELPTGGYAIVGRSKTLPPSPLWDAFLMLVDASGIPIPGQTFIIQGAADDEAYSVICDAFEQVLVVAGWTNSFSFFGQPNPDDNLFVWRHPLSGMGGWANIYGWPDDEEKVMDDQSLIQDPADGSYVVSGWTFSRGPEPLPNANFLVMKVEQSAGTVVWARTHPSVPGALDEKAYPMDLRVEGGFAIAGYNASFQPGLDDFHLLTLDAMGSRPFCTQDAEPELSPFEEISWDSYDWGETYFVVPYPVEDFDVESKPVCRKDVGSFQINGLPADVDSMTYYTPTCSLFNCNWGGLPESYNVRLKILDASSSVIHEEVKAVASHAPGTAYNLSFSAYRDWPRGSITVQCSTELANDEDNTNDLVTFNLTGHVRDVAVIQIFEPTATHDSGTTVTPACSVYNYGTDAVSYTHLTLPTN